MASLKEELQGQIKALEEKIAGLDAYYDAEKAKAKTTLMARKAEFETACADVPTEMEHVEMEYIHKLYDFLGKYITKKEVGGGVVYVGDDHAKGL